MLKDLKIKRRLITWAAALHLLGNPSKGMKVVGVTGTNGKTTVSTLLYRVATALGYKAGLIGTVESIVAGEVRETTHTTPDPINLNKLLKDMKAAGCEYVFMEISSHAMSQNRVAGVKFTGGVFTNLTHDHLDYHKSFEEYFDAKHKFFESLPKGAFALSNADDEYGKKMLEGIRARQYLYEFKNVGGPAVSEDSFQGEIVKADAAGIELKLRGKVIKSKLLGKFNAYNLLAAWSASSLLGFDMEKVNKILETIEPPRGRFESLQSPTGVVAIVDYAHTPDALEKILIAVREICPPGKRIISLFGCGGDRDPMKRPIMGRIGATLSDVAIFTSDNPRHEDPEFIIAAMQEELSPDLVAKIRTIPDRREAIRVAVGLATPGDIIVCAGKGHEDYQVIGDTKHHLSDREEFEKLF